MKKAFTLIELIIVVAIIAILSVIIVYAIGNAQAKSRDTKRKADLKAVAGALEAYRSQIGRYPAVYDCRPYDSSYFTQLDRSSGVCAALKVLVDKGYLSAFPVDPKSSSSSPSGYFYTSYPVNSGENFKIVKFNPELLDTDDSASNCKSIAEEFYDPYPSRVCNAYQVNSNSSVMDSR